MIGWTNAALNMSFGKKELEFLNSRNGDVYYVGFGSQFVLPLDKLMSLSKKLVEMTKTKIISVLFSIVDEELNKKMNQEFRSNKEVMISKWVNQRAVLNHKKVKLFFTHGGLSGIVESVFGGKPMIVLPLGADQFFNSIRIKELGLGVYYDWLDQETNLSSFEDEISKIENNYLFYKDKCSEISRINSLISNPSIICNLIEAFFISPKFFLDPSSSLSPIVVYNLDIISIFLFVFLLFFWILKKIVCSCKKPKIKKD